MKNILLLTLLTIASNSAFAGFYDDGPVIATPDAGASALLLSIGVASMAVIRRKLR